MQVSQNDFGCPVIRELFSVQIHIRHCFSKIHPSARHMRITPEISCISIAQFQVVLNPAPFCLAAYDAALGSIYTSPKNVS